jgi:hypothetical protein
VEPRGLPERREGHAWREALPASATPGGGRLWERFYALVDRPGREDAPPLWMLAWLIMPLVAGVGALWLSAVLAQVFAGPRYSWWGFVIAFVLGGLAAILLARPAVLRLAREREQRPAAARETAGWSFVLCLACVAAGAALGQGLDNSLLLALALVATGAALLVVLGLRAGWGAVYVAGAALTWAVLILGGFVAVLALIRTGACAVGDCL